MSDSFASRSGASRTAQEAVIARLIKSGYNVCATGIENMLPKDALEALKKFHDPRKSKSSRKSRLRWLPDLFVWWDTPPPEEQSYLNDFSNVAFIEVKSSVTDSTNWSVEVDSLEAAKVWDAFAPTYFSFDIDYALSVHDVTEHAIPGVHRDKGSGTPFVIIGKHHGVLFDTVFPQIL